MVFIIAEAGVNHNGDIGLAKKMVDAAYEAGCDAVKFQTFITEEEISVHAEMAEYQKENTGDTKSQLEMVKPLELKFEAFKILKEYCQEKGIMFLSTPFDFKSVDFLDSIDVSMFKIPSGEINNHPFLSFIASKKKPIIISTGMSSLKEVEDALEIIKAEGVSDITVLHCTSNYPTRYEDVNLKAMLTMEEYFKLPVGYSDHTLGIEVPIAAVVMGAKVIEKHFTLDKSMEGPDHKSSLSPEELKLMVESIRNIEKALGDGVKEIRPNEVPVRDIARKSIVANSNINKGEVITREKITFKRPGTGIEPKLVNDVIGLIAKEDISYDELITWDKLIKV